MSFNDFKKERKEGRKWLLWIIGVVVVFSILFSILGVVGKVASTPGRVLNKTLETENVITQYEFYYDTFTSYQSRSKQIAEFVDRIRDEEDKVEARFLRTELSGQRQSCRDMVAKYNSNSQKLTTKLFKGWDLPQRLDLNTCEYGG